MRGSVTVAQKAHNLRAAGSIPAPATNFLRTGVWCRGNILVSKTIVEGSIPSTPATMGPRTTRGGRFPGREDIQMGSIPIGSTKDTYSNTMVDTLSGVIWFKSKNCVLFHASDANEDRHLTLNQDQAGSNPARCTIKSHSGEQNSALTARALSRALQGKTGITE